MGNSRTVKVAWTQKTATFTQRGRKADRGFIRMNGVTITGIRIGETFYTDGLNSEVPYREDITSWSW